MSHVIDAFALIHRTTRAKSVKQPSYRGPLRVLASTVPTCRASGRTLIGRKLLLEGRRSAGRDWGNWKPQRQQANLSKYFSPFLPLSFHKLR
ncbi:hypothetical protein QQF64_028368 [Cirrhinus molitorella]|uniref:Uncharacterized protein n=1 Tax=Cirrhinus molitorella TaxID=172907 RepID=A0ABR3N6Q8_9TELE